MGHRRLAHTGDTGLELWADSLPLLFVEALRGFTDTVLQLSKVGSGQRRSFSVRAPELDRLLVQWLEELLYEFEVNALVFSGADVNISEYNGGWELRAIAWGESYNAARHRLKVPVKGVTYHGLSLREDQDTWRGRIVFDI